MPVATLPSGQWYSNGTSPSLPPLSSTSVGSALDGENAPLSPPSSIREQKTRSGPTERRPSVLP